MFGDATCTWVGLSVFANANRASGKENSDTDSYTETHITAGQALTFAHAGGSQTLEAIVQRQGRSWQIAEVVMTRHARPLMQGTLYIPD